MKVGKEELVGYVIAEAADMELESPKVVGGTDDEPLVEAILQRVNKDNRNGRKYLSEDFFTAVFEYQRIKELMKNMSLFGENGHPLDKSLGRQQVIDPNNLFCLYHKLWKEKDLLKAIVGAAPTATGDEFNRAVQKGVKNAYSLRALGKVVSTAQGNVVKDLKPVTWDRVIFPSHPEAYDQFVIGESTTTENGIIIPVNEFCTSSDYLIPITNEKVIAHIQESSDNLKQLTESFELMYSKIDVLPDGNVKLVTESGDIFVVGIEDMVKRDVRDFCSRLNR